MPEIPIADPNSYTVDRYGFREQQPKPESDFEHLEERELYGAIEALRGMRGSRVNGPEILCHWLKIDEAKILDKLGNQGILERLNNKFGPKETERRLAAVRGGSDLHNFENP